MLNGLSEVKRQPLKMVKHTQTIRRTFADKLFERVWPLCGVDAYRLKIKQLFFFCNGVGGELGNMIVS